MSSQDNPTRQATLPPLEMRGDDLINLNELPAPPENLGGAATDTTGTPQGRNAGANVPSTADLPLEGRTERTPTLDAMLS